MAENNQQAPSIEERIGIVTVELAANGVTLHSQGKWSELDMSSSMTPETALLELDLRQRLAHYLTTLPPREAEVIRMKYLNEKTLEEIRPRFGVSRSMVCRLHTDGLYTLKKLFTENCKPVPAQPSPVQSNSVQYQTAA
jgi:RNA polymerase sigma factor (sigma-70 family)